MIPILGCLWLGVAILFGKTFSSKKIFIPIFLVILLVACIGCVNFTQTQINDQIHDTNKTNMIDETFGSGNLIIYDAFVPYFEMKSYYMPDNHNFILTVTKDKNFNNTADQISGVLADPGIQNEIAQGSKVYFISYKHYDNEITLNHDTYNLKKIPVALDKYDAYEVELK